MSRDIEHEQISDSTDAQLTERLEQIRYGAVLLSGHLSYEHDELREMHKIISELYCRAHAIESRPWVTVCPDQDFVNSLQPEKFAHALRTVRRSGTNEVIAHCCSNTMAQRISNALNQYKAGSRGY